VETGEDGTVKSVTQLGFITRKNIMYSIIIIKDNYKKGQKRKEKKGKRSRAQKKKKMEQVEVDLIPNCVCFNTCHPQISHFQLK